MLLSAALGSCNPDRPTGVAEPCFRPGEFVGTLTGAATASIKACASFWFNQTTISGLPAPAFQMEFARRSEFGQSHYISVYGSTDRLSVGTHAVGGDGLRMSYSMFEGETDRPFDITGGSVSISISSPTQIAGSLSVTGVDVRAVGQPAVSLTGQFNATCYHGSYFPC